MSIQAERQPVIIGVGQINDRAESDAAALDTLALMKAAIETADRDGGGGLIRRLDWLGIVDQMSWPKAHWPGGGAITPYLTAALGIAPAITELSEEPSGDAPIRLLNEAANRIARGETRVAAIVGGEALRTEARRAAARGGPGQDLVREVTERRAGPLKLKYGLLSPAEVYPLYENACRAAWGQSLAEAQAETAAIWAGMSEAAADNPDAWIRRAVTAADLLEVSRENRMISFPYTKLMVANSSVNQGAAVIVTSLALARDLGIAEDRLIHVGAGAAAHEPSDFLARERFDQSHGMEVSIRRTLALNGLGPADLDRVELYSCFPCVPKLARRILDWPLDKRHSVYGGLTFGGGPIGNCMTHAIATMANKLRQSGSLGLIYANGGFATHSHTIVLATRPLGALPADWDYQSEADRLRGSAPILIDPYTGPGSVESYIVPFGRAGNPVFATIVGRTPSGHRFLARVPGEDQTTLNVLVSGTREPVGLPGEAFPGTDGLTYWRFIETLP
jgi:acetyl-CoA C-acetyltransferase